MYFRDLSGQEEDKQCSLALLAAFWPGKFPEELGILFSPWYDRFSEMVNHLRERLRKQGSQ